MALVLMCFYIRHKTSVSDGKWIVNCAVDDEARVGEHSPALACLGDLRLAFIYFSRPARADPVSGCARRPRCDCTRAVETTVMRLNSAAFGSSAGRREARGLLCEALRLLQACRGRYSLIAKAFQISATLLWATKLLFIEFNIYPKTSNSNAGSFTVNFCNSGINISPRSLCIFI